MEEPVVTFLALVLPLMIPTYTAWAHPNWKGVVLGALTLWVFLFMAFALIIGRYGGGPVAGAGMIAWAIGGWFPASIYCLGVAGICKAVRKAKALPRVPDPSRQSDGSN